MKNEQRFYKTTDLALSACLLYFGFSVIDTTRENDKVVFIFDKNKKLENYLKEYWDKKLSVEPNKFFYELKGIKARIYQR